MAKGGQLRAGLVVLGRRMAVAAVAAGAAEPKKRRRAPQLPGTEVSQTLGTLFFQNRPGGTTLNIQRRFGAPP